MRGRRGTGLCRAATVALVAFGWVSQAPAEPDPGRSDGTPLNASAASIEAIEQDANGVTLLVRIPREALSLGLDAEGRRTVVLGGAGVESRPGYPELPVLVASIAVPDGATLRIETALDGERTLAGPPIRPAARFDPRTGDPIHEPHPEIYARQSAWPDLVLVDDVRFRELRVARLAIHPIRYRPDRDELLVPDSVRIRVTFDGGSGFRVSEGHFGGAIERLRRQVLLNGASAADPRHAAPGRVRATAPEPTPKVANHGVKVRVGQAGLVHVTYAALQAAGWNPGPVDPHHIEVSYRETPVPCRVVGAADGSFDPGDAVEFYGVPATSRFARENIYWLIERSSPGLRFPSIDATPAAGPLIAEFQETLRVEDGNSIYTLGEPATEGDPRFFWAWFENAEGAPRITTLLVSKALPGLGGGPSAKMRASFLGRTDPVANPDHRVRFRVNGLPIGMSDWNGKTFHTAEFPFSRALLTASNAFRIDWRNIAFPDIYYLDWMEVDYPRVTAAVGDRLTITGVGGVQRYRVSAVGGIGDPVVLDVTDPHAPVELANVAISGAGPHTLEFQVAGPAGERYLVAGDAGRVAPVGLALDTPSHLKSSDHGADLIVVVPDGWENTLAPLVAYRRAQGLRVVLAGLTDVADEFAGGNVDDVAIRDFVRWAYDNYEGPPVSHLLLVGEPNLDPLNDMARADHHHLMPTHFGVTEAQGETPSDTWFGAVSGDDLLPDIAVARFSVRDTKSAGQVVAKVLGYEETPPGAAPWAKRLLHVASNDPLFENAFDNLAPLDPPDFTVAEEYRSAGATSATIRTSIDLGALVVTFFGHGNVLWWADNPGGIFFAPSHVDALFNSGRLPLVAAMNCLNGLVADPFNPTSLAEAFHNQATTGAIAVWSPSALGFLRQYDELTQVFYDTLFVDGVRELGQATTASLVEAFLTRPVSIDTVKEMVLLGDPTTRLAVECAAADGTCDGIDDDCDGSADEDFAPLATRCGLGPCAATGATSCVNGAFIDSCNPAAPAAADATCNGIDDDCDGLVDENYPVQTTFCGIGGCAITGQQECAGGTVVDNCLPLDPAPHDPTCDGVDDDCDGVADENFTAGPTTCGLGICVAAGVTSCADHVLMDSCVPGPAAPNDVSCNNIDNDCNGLVDEDFPQQSTSCGVGACSRIGTTQCVGGAVSDTCTPGTPASSDASCNNVDNDCNGAVDEDFVSQPTSCGVGACVASGSTSCVNGTLMNSCTPGTPAASDASCNNVDNDCNGAVDEDFPQQPTTCGVGACFRSGSIVCVGGVVDDTCTPGTPAPSDASCNNVDNDCDQQIDEDFVSQSTTCGVGACAASGNTSCANGILVDTCTPLAPAPTDATCNSVDDDCNGMADEDFPGQVTACGVGACAAQGTTVCISGGVEDTCLPLAPGTEVCDTLDNDCDGLADEADAIGQPDWHHDADLDGHGNVADTQQSCAQPRGYVSDGTDCDDANPQAWATPGEIRALRFDDRTTLAWDLPLAPGGVVTTFVLRSADPAVFVDATTCLDGGTGTSLSDLDSPPPGAAWFYLGRAVTACPAGEGTLGVDSSGQPRTGRSCP